VFAVDDGRIGRYHAVRSALAALDDRELGARLDGATRIGSGIGGQTARLRIGDVPVFVKRVPLTDLERLPEHAADVIRRYGPQVLVLNEFYDRLTHGPKSTPYPAGRLAGRDR
jgi:hypothetical protein